MSKFEKPSQPRGLTPQQANFVAEYLKDGDATRAAISAGYAEKAASSIASRFLNRHPGVMEAIAKVRNKAMIRGVHNLEKAMEEAEEAMRFAKETENAGAFTKAVELRARLSGLMVEKHEVKQAGFMIQINGISGTTPALPDPQSLKNGPEGNRIDESVESDVIDVEGFEVADDIFG